MRTPAERSSNMRQHRHQEKVRGKDRGLHAANNNHDSITILSFLYECSPKLNLYTSRLNCYKDQDEKLEQRGRTLGFLGHKGPIDL